MIFTNKTIDKLDKMIDDALNGTFSESSYDETRMSRLESKWKEFLGNSVLSNQNLEAERRRLEQFISDISHQTKTPMTNIKMYTELLYEEAVKINTSNRSAAEVDKMNSSTHSDTEADKMKSSTHSAGESVRINSSNHSSAELEKSTQKILKYAEEIKRQNQRLEFLIDSLTKLSRLESGTLEVVAEHSDVNELINSAVAAAKLCPEAADYMFPSHQSFEIGYKKAVTELGLHPYLDLGMRLGEGSGCVIGFEVIRAACAVMDGMATFAEGGINDDYLEEIRKGDCF